MSLAAVGITSAALGAGASIYGASQAGKTGSAPRSVDIFENARRGRNAGTNLVGRQATGLIDYYDENTPRFLQLSERFGPQFMQQMFGQTGQFFSGVNGQPGFNALQLSTSQEAGKTLGQIRAEELAQMTGQTGLARGLMQSLSPEQAAVVQASAQEAERARASAQGVTPEEKRMYEQAAREAFQASGRVGGNASIAAEIMGREDLMRQKRQEAAMANNNAFNQAASFYTQPGLQALSEAPLSYNAGQKNLALGLQLGPASSGEFDYNMPVNLAMNQAGAQNQANMANYSINAANQQARANAFSSIGGGLMGLGLGSIANSGVGFPGSMSAGNMGSYFGNLGRSASGQPLRAYTV